MAQAGVSAAQVATMPAMAAEVLHGALTLAVLVLDGFLQHASAVRSGPLELGIHVGHAHLDHVGHDTRQRGLLLPSDVRDDHRTVALHARTR